MPAKINRSSLPLWRQDFRLTLRLALPLIFAEVGWMSMGIADTIMAGRLPNSAVAIGATGLGQSLYASLAIFAGGLLLGMDTFVAHAFGREDLDDARHSLANGLFLACARASSDACGVILAGADAALRDQRGARRADASIPVRFSTGVRSRCSLTSPSGGICKR